MKHVIVCGTCRAGKTMLALELKKQVPELNYISQDIMRLALKKVSDKDYEAAENLPYFQNFIHEIYSRYNRYNEGFLLLEGIFIKADETVLRFDSTDTIIVFVGRPNITAEDNFKEIREAEKKTYSWTSERSDTDLLKMTNGWLQEDKRNLEFCDTHGFYFVDTSFNRATQIKSFAKKLAEELKK